MEKGHDDRVAPQRLRALCQVASEQAADIHGGRIDRFDQPATWRLRAIWFGLAAGCGAVIVAIAAEIAGDPSTDTVAAAASPAAAVTVRPVPPTVAAAVGPAPVGPVRWQDRQLAIDIEQLPLADATRLLAAATDTTLHGVESLPPDAVVTLHGRFGDVPAAWSRLLRGQVLYSLNCGGASACQLSIQGSVPAQAALPGKPDAAAAAEPDAPAAPRRNLLPGEADSQPDGAC